MQSLSAGTPSFLSSPELLPQQILAGNDWTTLAIGLAFICVALILFLVILTLKRRLADARRHHREDRDNLAKFSSAVMKSGSMIAITNRDGLIEYVNGRFCDITGYQPEDVIGRTLECMRGMTCTATEADDDLPTLISAQKQDWEGEVECMRKNGDSFWSAITVSAVRDGRGNLINFVVSGVDITELKVASQRMQQLALFDSLTGLANRRLFLDRLEQAINGARRHQRQVALLFLDLDQFKRINDTLGHDAGDLLLLTVADRLKSCVRGQDTVARLGGDEFTILLNDVRKSHHVTVAAKNILRTLKAPIRLQNQEVIVSTSIGVTVAPSDSDEPETLMKNADLALYRAKEKGRDRYHFFTEELNQRAIRQLHLEQELRHALEFDEFNLMFQPQIDLHSGDVVSLEALIRWHHPVRGKVVSPDEFIPVAEETGLIVPIGNWVLHNACMQLKLLHQLTGHELRVAVNLSARQFRDPALEQVISEALHNSGLAPSFLEIEVTESMLMDDIRSVTEQLQRIKDTGVTITIDDFGTGYSSLRYLKCLPVDVLKVDREFVQDIPDDLNDMEITSAVIAIAHKMGLKVIAEGVENLDQHDFLVINRCDMAQGYYFSRPLSFEAIYRKFGCDQELPLASRA